MDVKADHSHPKIDKEVYLGQPKGFEILDSKCSRLACKLKNQYMD